MPNDFALTTVDNPFDPFDQFPSWFLFDVEKGYYTCSMLGNLVELSDDMTQKEIDEETERAIDDIIKHDPLNIYKKIFRSIADDSETATT